MRLAKVTILSAASALVALFLLDGAAIAGGHGKLSDQAAQSIAADREDKPRQSRRSQEKSGLSRTVYYCDPAVENFTVSSLDRVSLQGGNNGCCYGAPER